jgi:hypothetical protein
VVVYWADPTIGFANPNFLSATSVPVPPTPTTTSTTATQTMSPVVPATAPQHACLLVQVSHPQDKAGKACDPLNDRHWAQRNLFAVQAAMGAPAIMPLNAANPFLQGGDFFVVLGPADRRRAGVVAREFRTEPADVPMRLRLLNEDGTSASDEGRRVRVPVQLGPLERRRFQVMVQLDADVPAGRSAVVEAHLVDARRERPIGSLGIVLLAP